MARTVFGRIVMAVVFLLLRLWGWYEGRNDLYITVGCGEPGCTECDPDIRGEETPPVHQLCNEPGFPGTDSPRCSCGDASTDFVRSGGFPGPDHARDCPRWWRDPYPYGQTRSPTSEDEHDEQGAPPV